MLAENDAEQMTEAERCAAGLWYDANFDPELLARREQAADRCHAFNTTLPSDAERRKELLHEIFGAFGARTTVLEPLYVDYGYNCRIGADSFINHGAYLMDGAPITIGDHVFIGPNFGAYTAQHPLVAEERNRGLERALPITVEDDVWIGADVKVMPGVTIGADAVIGAGSVVTRDIPGGMLALGTPAKPVRPITAADRIA